MAVVCLEETRNHGLTQMNTDLEKERPVTDERREAEGARVGYDDGSVVFTATFTPKEPALPAVHFTYHPVAAARMARYQKGMADVASVWPTSKAIIARHVTAWDLVKPSGEAVSHTDERELDRVLYQIVLGVAETILDAVNDTEAEGKNS